MKIIVKRQEVLYQYQKRNFLHECALISKTKIEKWRKRFQDHYETEVKKTRKLISIRKKAYLLCKNKFLNEIVFIKSDLRLEKSLFKDFNQADVLDFLQWRKKIFFTKLNKRKRLFQNAKNYLNYLESVRSEIYII
jgi:hypothetical protein